MTGRHTVTALTLAIVAAIFVAMAVWGVLAATSPFPHHSATASCSGSEVQVKDTLARREVKISVFNAGAAKGDATSTLAALEQRGFIAGDASNAPPGTTVARAEVWTTTRDDPAAELVAENIARGTPVKVSSQDLGPGVDVLIGPQFHRLAPHAPRTVKLSHPAKSCVKVR